MDTTVNRGLVALRALKVVQTEIASAVGVTQQSVSNWIRGESLPGREAAAKLEAHFGIPASSWSSATKPAQKIRARKVTATRPKPGTARAGGAGAPRTGKATGHG